MDVHEALRDRRTVHRFAVGPVPQEALERALQAATYAPNHKLTWPWRFVLPGPDARADLAELGVRLKSADRQLSSDMQHAVRTKLLNPDRLVVVCQVLADDAFRREEDYATCAAAIQNMSLSLHADGLHSKWSTGGVTRHVETYARLGIDPTVERIVGFVWVGRAEAVPAPAARPSWQDVTRSVP